MNSILRKLIRLQNPLMKWLLRSPFHGFVSRFYMLITVTGRKSGRLYETPVQYHQDGLTLWIITSETYQWWRNLQGGAPVRVYLRGHDYEACATPFLDKDIVRAALKQIYPSFGTDQCEQMARGAVALEVRLNAV